MMIWTPHLNMSLKQVSVVGGDWHRLWLPRLVSAYLGPTNQCFLTFLVFPRPCLKLLRLTSVFFSSLWGTCEWDGNGIARAKEVDSMLVLQWSSCMSLGQSTQTWKLKYRGPLDSKTWFFPFHGLSRWVLIPETVPQCPPAPVGEPGSLASV